MAVLLESTPASHLNLQSFQDIHGSLQNFCVRMNNGGVNDLLISHLRKGETPGEGSFVAAAALHSGWKIPGRDPRDGVIWSDGRHALALGFHAVDANSTRWLAGLSFSLGEDLRAYSVAVETTDLAISAPVVVQLQGPGRRSYRENPQEGMTSLDDIIRFQESRDIIASYRWEKAMLRFIINWATQEGIPSVYQVGADRFKWLKPGSEEYLRYYLRYDVTAKRCGLRTMGNGLYGIALN